MYATRITPFVLICVLIGCRTSEVTRDSDYRAIESGSLGDSQFGAPLQQSVVPTPAVQPAAFVEPVEAPIVPEPEILPTPVVERELTLEELEHIAMTNNPSLAEALARVEAAQGKWLQVGLPPNTVVGYAGQQLGSDGKAEQQGLFVGQEFVRGGKLNLNRAVVGQEIQKAEQIWAAQQQRVLTDVRLAYYEVLVAQRRNDTAGKLVEIARQAVEAAEALFRAKEVSQVDVMRARIELQSAELLLKNAKNIYTAAWSRLAAVIGLHDLRPQPLQGDVERKIDPIDADIALQRLVNESPEMAAAMSEVARARWAVDRAYAEPIPNVDVQAVVQSDNGTRGSNANLQVTIPIPWLNRNQGGIRQAESEVVAAERSIDRLELSFKQRLADVYQRYANARNQVEAYSKQDGILANSSKTLEFARKGYEAGEFSYLDLLTAQRTFSHTNLAYIEALGELWAAVVEIDGLLLKGSLDSGNER